LGGEVGIVRRLHCGERSMLSGGEIRAFTVAFLGGPPALFAQSQEGPEPGGLACLHTRNGPGYP
jgi:hypothetical protein